MKKRLIYSTMALVLATSACKKEYFETKRFAGGSYGPTVAVPIAELEMQLSDLLKKYDNEINLVYDPNVDLSNGDSAFYLELIFTDTLEPLSLDNFDTLNIIAPITISLPKEKVDLRVFGSLDGDPSNFFRLTNPSVRFNFENTTDYPFEIEFRDGTDTNLYTENTETGEKRFLEIVGGNNPYTVPANSGSSSLVLTNDNVQNISSGSGALTEVFEPTPKFLYYGIDITPLGSGTNTGGHVQVYADVVLPLEGYGNIVYNDTSTYEVEDFEEEGTDNIDFVELRLIVENGLPMEAKISATVYDTTSGPWEPVLDLPLFENGQKDVEGIVVRGAKPSSSPPFRPVGSVTETTDVRIEGADLDAFLSGQKVVITANFYTSGYDDEDVVKLYDDYSLKVQLGARAKAAANIGDFID